MDHHINKNIETAVQSPNTSRVRRVATAMAPLLMLAACGQAPKESGGLAEATGPSAAIESAEAMFDIDLPTPNEYGTPVERTAYWAAGGANGDLSRASWGNAEEAAEEAAGTPEERQAKETLSALAANQVGYWTEGGNNDVDKVDLDNAEHYAEEAAEHGSYGDEAYTTLQKAAEERAKYWAAGGKDKRGSSSEDHTAQKYREKADRYGQQAKELK